MATTREVRDDRLRRVYTGITLSRDDLARLHAAFRECGWRTVMHANTFQLHEFDELDAVMDEDHLIEHISMTSELPRTGGSGRLHMTFDLGYVQLEADDPAWSSGFHRIAALLDAIPKNGTTRCSVSLRRRAARAALPPSEPSAALEPLSAPSATATAPPVRAAPSAAPSPVVPGTATLTPVTGAQAIIPSSQPTTEQLRGGRLPRVQSGASGSSAHHPRASTVSQAPLRGPQPPATEPKLAVSGSWRALWLWLAIDAALLIAVAGGMLGLFQLSAPAMGIPLLIIGAVAATGTVLAAVAGSRRRRSSRP